MSREGAIKVLKSANAYGSLGDCICKALALLESEPELGELSVNTSNMLKAALSIKDGQGTRAGSMAKMLIDCCKEIDRLRAELALLKSKPEPGELTKEIRYIVDEKGIDDPLINIAPEIVLKACDIIDRQANDIDQYRDMLKARKEEIDRLRAEFKAKDKITTAQKEYINLLGEELDETVSIAYTHGWKSTRHEKGKKLRAKIEQTLKEKT